MPIHSPLNLAAIASKAKVSRMTVSRVLRNVSSVKEDTRRRVLAVAEEMGYRPNPLVSAFMTFVRSNRQRRDVEVLAYLTSGATRNSWRTNATYVRFFQGAQIQAEHRGYAIEEFWLKEPGFTAKRISQILYTRGIRGIILGPMLSAHGHLNLDWKRFSAAAIGYSLLKPDLPRATNDQYGSMLIALRELRRLGYRHVALVMPYNNDARVCYHWSAAFLSHHWRYHAGQKPAIHLPKIWNREKVLAWVTKTRPEAIVTNSTLLPRWLRECRVPVPEEIGVVNLDWSEQLGSYAGIDERSEEVGAAAVDLVVEQIYHNERGIPIYPRVVLLPGVWAPGPTVRSMKTAGLPPRSLAKKRKPRRVTRRS